MSSFLVSHDYTFDEGCGEDSHNSAILSAILSAKRAPNLAQLKQDFRAPTMAEPRWLSDSTALNHFFKGGLRSGFLYEWGLSFGAGAYGSVVLPWLKAITQEDPLLWVKPKDLTSLYPPSLATEGVKLANFSVASSEQPVADLKAAFLQPGFSCIVLDRPRGLRKQDMAFLAHAARKNDQTIIVLRPHLLSSKIPNPWASVRLNTKYLPSQRMYLVESVRGLAKKNLLVSAPEKLKEQKKFLRCLLEDFEKQEEQRLRRCI